jgi:hypothetical protein
VGGGQHYTAGEQRHSLPSLANLPTIVLYLAQYTMETVVASAIVGHLVNCGCLLQPLPSNSVVVLLPLDNEKKREQTIHLLRNFSQTNTEDGPLAISFGAQSICG